MEKREKAMKKLVAGLMRFEADLTETFFGGNESNLRTWNPAIVRKQSQICREFPTSH